MSSHSESIPEIVKFCSGGVGGICATMVSYPLDLLKLNMQYLGKGTKTKQYKTTVQLAYRIVKRDGFFGLYNGISACVLRQLLYTGARLGVFQTFMERYSKRGKRPTTAVNSKLSFEAGVIGGIVGLPPDVVMTRMAIDKCLPPDHRRNYAHVFDAIYRISKEEGPMALSRGIGPKVLRTVIVNMSQLVTYVEAKDFLVKHNIMKDNNLCYIISSLISSLVTTACILPPDMAKTRLQSMRVVNNVPEYKHMVDVWVKIVNTEGIFALWRGFSPLFLRNGLQYMITLIVYENLLHHYKDFNMK